MDGYEDFVSSASNKWDKTISGMTYALMTPVACCKSAYLISPFTCAVAASPTSSNYMTVTHYGCSCFHSCAVIIINDMGNVGIFVKTNVKWISVYEKVIENCRII